MLTKQGSESVPQIYNAVLLPSKPALKKTSSNGLLEFNAENESHYCVYRAERSKCNVLPPA